MVIRYLIAFVLMIAANYFWAYHDWYFWDKETKQSVIDIYKDWHNLKVLMLVSFGLSVWVCPKTLICGLGLIFTRWASFEMFCHIASMSKDYEPDRVWLDGKLGLNVPRALFILGLACLIPLI